MHQALDWPRSGQADASSHGQAHGTCNAGSEMPKSVRTLVAGDGLVDYGSGSRLNGAWSVFVVYQKHTLGVLNNQGF